MRKFSFAVAAVAVLALPGTAEAKGPLLNLGDMCKSLLVLVDHTRVSGYPVRDCQIGNVVGVIGTVKGTEGRLIIGGSEVLGHHRPYLIEISYPLVDGGTLASLQGDARVQIEAVSAGHLQGDKLTPHPCKSGCTSMSKCSTSSRSPSFV